MTERAQKLVINKALLTPKDYRFHFYAWWQEPKYRLAANTVDVSDKDHEYFDLIEAAMRCKIDMDQRAWYVATRDSDFSTRRRRPRPSKSARRATTTPKTCWPCVSVRELPGFRYWTYQ